MELVEAPARSGRYDEAAAHVAAACEAHIGELSPRVALIVSRAAAMAAADRDHRDLFERALRTPNADQWPFDLARVQLACGERLRRTQSPPDARAHLSAAIYALSASAPGHLDRPFGPARRSPGWSSRDRLRRGCVRGRRL
jgi:hypothetical protein